MEKVLLNLTETAAEQAAVESVSFAGLAPGPRLLVLGAVHGNEVCGPRAIARAIDDCRQGRIQVRRGALTFVPVCNRKAHARGTREGDRNLNRNLFEKPQPADYEDRIGNLLCALLRRHDVLLDLHSFSGEGRPFVFFGPEDNTGELEPFARAAAEASFAAALGTSLAMHGWLESYQKLRAARQRMQLAPLPATEGHGTTEYIRFSGGYGVTLECGSHADPAAAELAHQAIVRALAHLRLTDAPRPESRLDTVIQLIDAVAVENPGDRLQGQWRTGDPIAAGQAFGQRHDGCPIAAPTDGFLVFPNPNAQLGQSLCYFGVRSERKL
jgi:predicted deacylase